MKSVSPDDPDGLYDNSMIAPDLYPADHNVPTVEVEPISFGDGMREIANAMQRFKKGFARFSRAIERRRLAKLGLSVGFAPVFTGNVDI